MAGLKNNYTKALQGLLDPFPDDAIYYCQVSKQVNSVRKNSLHLIEQYRNLFE